MWSCVLLKKNPVCRASSARRCVRVVKGMAMAVRIARFVGSKALHVADFHHWHQLFPKKKAPGGVPRACFFFWVTHLLISQGVDDHPLANSSLYCCMIVADRLSSLERANFRHISTPSGPA